MGYFKTLIAVADDCPVTRSEVPAPRGTKKTVAVLQYEMLAERPFQLTQEDILFGTLLRQREEAGDPVPAGEQAALREEYFATDRACLRASPLPKRHGWGLMYDEAGRVALCPMESAEYQAAIASETPGITVIKAMRSRRT